MIKKIITTTIITLIISIATIQHSPLAQEIGVGEIIFQKPTNTFTEHGFSINEIGYTAIKLHMNIAGKDLESIYYQGEILETIKKLEELTKTDVIQLLDIAKNKEEALYTYLNTCFQELQKGKSISAYMKQEMGIIKIDMEACIKDKNVSDKTYFEAINRYDQNIMNIALQDSIKHEICATEKRIQYNAKVSVARKLVFYLSVLQKKYDILFDKQEIVAKNFEIFRDNILPDLNQIDQLLKQYTF